MINKRERLAGNIKTVATFAGVVSVILIVLVVGYGIFGGGYRLDFIERAEIIIVGFVLISPIGIMSLLLYGAGELIEIQCEQKETLTSISINTANKPNLK